MESPEAVNILIYALIKEHEEMRELDKSEGIDVEDPSYAPMSYITECLKAFKQYRRSRIVMEFETKIPNNLSPMQMRQRMQTLDRERRYAHNDALGSVNGLNRSLKRYGLPKLYTGIELTDDDITAHSNHQVIGSYTDFFFDLLNKIENMSINTRDLRLENSKESDQAIDVLRTVARSIHKDDRDYGVKEPISSDRKPIRFEGFDR